MLETVDALEVVTTIVVLAGAEHGSLQILDAISVTLVKAQSFAMFKLVFKP